MFRLDSARALLRVALATATLALMGSAHAAPRTNDQPAQRQASKPRPPLVIVRTIGSMPEASARLACRALLAQLNVRCEIRGSRSVVDLSEALDADRDQLDARAALELMFRDRAADALIEINLTRADIFESNKPFVFGLASLSDRIALISMARLETADQDVFAARLTKLVMHEAGHTFGLHHHDDEDCVMRQDPSVASLDDAPTTPCKRCHDKLARRADRLSRPGQLALDRARSHLARDEAATARQLLLGTVWADAYNDAVLHDFGMAFQNAGQLDDAIGIFKFLVENTPAHARAHVSIAIAYEARGSQGDLARAIAHLDRAAKLRPDWSTVAAHRDRLRNELDSAS